METECLVRVSHSFHCCSAQRLSASTLEKPGIRTLEKLGIRTSNLEDPLTSGNISLLCKMEIAELVTTKGINALLFDFNPIGPQCLLLISTA